MVKSRTTQLIFQSIYIGIAIIAIIASFGLFEMIYRWDFYVHFTNLSNYLCAIIMFLELRDTARRSSDGYVATYPVVKFMSLLAILLTFIIFNFVLAQRREPIENFKVSSITLHMILPIMYTLDYILFYEHGKTKWNYPIISALFPLIYVAFIYIHAAIRNFDSSIYFPGRDDPLIYPYFFLNLDKYGVAGVIKNCVLITVCFIAFGYVVMFIDNVLCKLMRGGKND